MFGALRSLPSVPLGSGPTPVEELTRLRAVLWRRTAPAREARRRDRVCVRRQQGPQDAARRRAGAGGRRRHAHHHGRRAIEPRAGDGGGGREARAEMHPRRERRGTGASDCQRAPRPPARGRRPLRRIARGARAGDGAGGGRRAPIGGHALRHSARRLHAARRGRVRRRHRRAGATRSIPRTSSCTPRRLAARRPASLPAALLQDGRRV